MARTKHVVPHDEVAQLWLKQEQSDARSKGGGTMYFEGATIYSYGSHFPIARITKAPNGEEVVLLTTRKNSMTTNSHIAVVRSAANRDPRRVVYCNDVSSISHDCNMLDFKRERDAQVEKHNKARKPELYTAAILRQAEQAREYCEVMCIPVPQWANLPDPDHFVETDKLFKGLPMRAVLAASAPQV